MPHAPVHTGELYYEITGNGPPLLLAAGLGGLGSFWLPQLASLSRRFTVLTYDHRGSGRSSRTPPPYSIDGMADDALALLDHVGFETVQFVGHSTGGVIGQCLANRVPGRIERLVLSATWTHCDPYFRRLFSLRRDIMAAGECDLYHRLATLLLYPPDWIAVHDDELADRSSLTTLDRDIVVGKIDALLAFDGRQGLSGVRCPTLVVASRDDVTVPSYFSVALAQAIAGARLSILDFGGHYFPITRAQEFGSLVLEFLTAPNVGDTRP